MARRMPEMKVVTKGNAILKGFIPVLFLIIFFTEGRTQDIPLFTQKLTNSFLYNPAVAGNALGSFTLSRRQYWSGVEGSPNTNFLSLHVPFAYHRFGFGVNVYQDNVGVSQTLFTSAAFAYHIRLTDDNSFSMGVAAEYDLFKVNRVDVDVADIDDELLSNFNNASQVDFSFGMSYHAKYFRLGVAANRIRDFLDLGDSVVNQFPAYYSSFLNLMLPLSGGRDLLEPVVTFRSLSTRSYQVDAGLYYTYKNLLTVGGGYRTGGVINLTAAVRYKGLLVGYSREMFSAADQRNIGATNEITFRIDFRDHAFHSKARNARQINTQAMAIRRKTLVTYSSRGTSAQKSQRYKKKIKKNYIHSPNYRINSSKKLQSMKVNKKSASYKRKKKSSRRRRR